MRLSIRASAGSRYNAGATPGSASPHTRLPRASDRHVASRTFVAIPREAPAATQSVEAPTIESTDDAAMLDHALLSASALQAPAQYGAVNRTGINGLTACGTEGLSTGSFEVRAVQAVSYSISEVSGLTDLENPALRRGVVPDSFPSQLAAEPTSTIGQRRFVIMDSNVHALHGANFERYFEHHGFEYKLLALPTNESTKSFDLVFEIAEQLELFGINRRKEPVIAIGGGVCLDVAGLAANLFRRNTPVIKVPTTLMAAVDAAVGIKTAVNFHNRKNKMGTYCPPLAVFLDRAYLRTLDQRNLSNGAAEMLKMACIKDYDLFSILEDHSEDILASKFQGPIAGTAMRRSIQGMLEELEPNLWEHVLCRLVDYGHTFSPEIEMAALASDDELLHGEAVNIDMALTTYMSFNRGLISKSERDRVLSVMASLQLPVNHAVCNSKLFMKALTDTTKARDGWQRMPLMKGIGSAVFVNDVSAVEIAAAATALGC